MPMARRLPEPAPDSYKTVDELTESLGRKGTAQPGDGLYTRDGMQEVTDIEEALSELTISGQERNVVVPSGMAAAHGAVQFALQEKGRESRSRGEEPRPTLAYPPYLYTQSTKAFEGLGLMGVSTTGFYAGDAESVGGLFDEGKADVIFAETVSNTPFMPVLDVPRLLERLRAAGDEGPILVLDNTLPLSTGIDFSEHLTDEDRVLVVESATKSAMHNSEHLGVAYSANEALVNGFRRYKVTHGLVTSVGANDAILKKLEATMPGFHDRNRALYESTGILAKWVAAAKAAKGVLEKDPGFDVAFPELDGHPNHGYAAEHLPHGTSPVVFVDRSIMEEGAAEEFLKKLAKHPDVDEQIREGQVSFGQSFGFKEARLLYDPDATQIRISGGYKMDSEALGRAIFQALVEID